MDICQLWMASKNGAIFTCRKTKMASIMAFIQSCLVHVSTSAKAFSGFLFFSVWEQIWNDGVIFIFYNAVNHRRVLCQIKKWKLIPFRVIWIWNYWTNLWWVAWINWKIFETSAWVCFKTFSAISKSIWFWKTHFRVFKIWPFHFSFASRQKDWLFSYCQSTTSYENINLIFYSVSVLWFLM